MKIILCFISFLILPSCKRDDSCLINYFVSGTLTDSSLLPVESADIYEITHYGYISTKPSARTDATGKFRYFLGSYSDVGNTYVFYRKTGYADLATAPIGKGNGSCGDQEIVRDGVMLP
jgi:hypothetical protein